MKYRLVILFLLVLFSGCSSRIVPAKLNTQSQDSILKQEKIVNDTLIAIEKNEKKKQIESSTLTYGVQYSLSGITNASIEVTTARLLNERIISILGTPHLDQVKKIKATVDLLNSELESERKKGLALLEERDKLIIKLQKEKAELKQDYDNQLWDVNSKAKEIAKQADASQATIDTMSGFFGLNAVIWGLKKFFISCLTGIIIFVVIFAILRILSTLHPAAAAAFSIFNLLGSAIINIIKSLTPKAFDMSNFTSKVDVIKFKNPLIKIIDTIEDFKQKTKDNPDRIYTLKDILNKFDKEMDNSDKDLIDELLIEQKWKR